MTVDRDDWTEAAGYFDGYAEGRYDADARIEWIWKASELRVSDDGTAMFFGRPGVDGIEFAIRRGSPAVWAFHPIGQEWHRLADDIGTFERGWTAGSITV